MSPGIQIDIHFIGFLNFLSFNRPLKLFRKIYSSPGMCEVKSLRLTLIGCCLFNWNMSCHISFVLSILTFQAVHYYADSPPSISDILQLIRTGFLLLFPQFSKIWLLWWGESLLERNLFPHIPLSKLSCCLVYWYYIVLQL